MTEHTRQLEQLGQEAMNALALKHTARERALPKTRTVIRYCANSIRATHRYEFEAAEQLLAQAGALLAEVAFDLQDQQDIFYAGFVQDAHKEYAEAAVYTALTQHRPFPLPSELSIGWAAYLNGLGEAVGELRRYILDSLRRGRFDDCELFLSSMDDIYALLTSVDFPDAITGGLRRTTDLVRGVLEKTRGDLTVAMGQAQLQHTLEEVRQHLSLTD